MPDAAPANGKREAGAFLRVLYGESAPGFLTFWRRQDKHTLWVPASDLEQAGRLVESSARTMDVYVGMGLRRIARGTHERGKLDDVIGIPSIWDDLDIRGPAHKKERLPATREEVNAFLAGLPIAPSLIVDSGWGIQPHWLLDRLWVFADETERQMAAALVRRFQAAIHQQAAKHGWTLDSTHDLTRVLRIPGTLNHKLTPVPVRALSTDPSRRYSRIDLEQGLPPLETVALPERSMDPVVLPPTLPVADLGALTISDWTKDLIRRGRGADPGHYPSRSEAAWRVLGDLIESGCSDADIASIFMDPAHAIGEKAREQGRRWLAGEIARARYAAEHAPRLVIHVSDAREQPAPVPRLRTFSDASVGAARIIVEVA